MFTSSLLPAIVSVIIYVALRYSPIDVKPNNLDTNTITIHANSISHNNVQSQKSRYIALTANKIVKYNNTYLTPEAHTSLWWLNRTMNTSSFKEWYNVSNKFVQFENSSTSSNNVNMMYANDVVLPMHVWYLYMAGNFVKWCQHLCNALQMYMNNVNSANALSSSLLLSSVVDTLITSL